MEAEEATALKAVIRQRLAKTQQTEKSAGCSELAIALLVVTCCKFNKSNYQSKPRLQSLIYVTILASHLRLGLPSGVIPSGLPIKILYAFLLSPYVLHALPT
jgi:hypothetical protein